MNLDPIALGALVLVVVVLLVLVYLSVRVVNEYARLVVFRFGRTGGDLVKGPGLIFLIPVVDRPVTVDLREQFIEVPSQTTITKDNAPDQRRLPDLLAHRRPAEERGAGGLLRRARCRAWRPPRCAR